jgi:hypothetical protein
MFDVTVTLISKLKSSDTSTKRLYDGLDVPTDEQLPLNGQYSQAYVYSGWAPAAAAVH